MAVVVEDQVVGAAGSVPITVDTMLLHSESPLSFVAHTLKNHSRPLSSPKT